MTASVTNNVPEVVQRPVAAGRCLRPVQRRPGRVVGQRPCRRPQRPPQRLVRTPQRARGQRLLVEPQPHERVRRCRQPLHRPRPLTNYRDQLLPRVDVGLGRAQQLRGPRAGGDPERHLRPVPMAGQRREQLVEPLVRNRPRHPRRHPRPIQPHPLVAERPHGVVMRVRPARLPLPHQRKRVHHRPRARHPVRVVERPQHRLTVGHRPRRVPRPRPCPPGHRVRRPRHRPSRTHRTAAAGRLIGDLQPPGEVSRVDASSSIPRHLDRPQEPEPAQQVQAV
jgi:hypothetical protein